VRLTTLQRGILQFTSHGSEALQSLLRIYKSNPEIQGLLQAAAMLLAVMGVDRLINAPEATRVLYILPIWIATRRVGMGWAFIVLLLVTMIVSAADHHSGLITNENLVQQSFFRFASMLAVMILIGSVERRLVKVQVQALQDPLTGSLNRAALQQYSTFHIDRAKTDNERLIVVLVDCDQFKQINDTYGHAVGDFILKLLARHLQTATKPHGIVARTGGDEFAVIMINAGRDYTIDLFTGINERFQAATIDRGCRASISFGVACLGVDGDDLESLMHAADARMYRHKASKSDMDIVAVANIAESALAHNPQ